MSVNKRSAHFAARRGILPALAAASLALLGGLCAIGRAQTGNTSEVNTQESQPAFRLQVERNLVLVRVVVRDSKGAVVTNLHKEDFRLYDNGKLQTISNFAVESASTWARSIPEPEKDLEGSGQPPAPPITVPERYTGLFFDDVHMSFEDIARSRDAAMRYLASSLQPTDRVGIFTSSGQGILDFTGDRAKLQQALARLHPRPVARKTGHPCPDISDYQAYQIVQGRDPNALEVATQETLQCVYGGDQRFHAQAQQVAQQEAFQAQNEYEAEALYPLRGLEQLVRRMASLPGQRSLVLVSSGFLVDNIRPVVSELTDRALRSNVVISALDARGLFVVVPGGSVDQPNYIPAGRPDVASTKTQLDLTRQSLAKEVMQTVAEDTGGSFFHNNNDLEMGFRKVGGLPEAYYVLAFTPQNLKPDGRFHPLKVKLVSATGFTLQARHGYFAPRQSEDPALKEKEEIEQAAFSRDELNELPMEVHTQFFKADEAHAQLAVLIHLDIGRLRFRKVEGRNLEKLVFVTALFDQDGKYVDAQQSSMNLRLLDSSLEKLMQTGLAFKASFNVPPGTYLVREVVRDGEGGQMSALNRSVEIPY